MPELVLAALAYLVVIFLAITCFHYFIQQQIRRRIRNIPYGHDDSREEEESPAIVDGVIVDVIPEDAIVVDAE